MRYAVALLNITGQKLSSCKRNSSDSAVTFDFAYSVRGDKGEFSFTVSLFTPYEEQEDENTNRSTPTYVPDFVDATHKLLEYDLTGIFHIVSPDFVNRYDFSLKVAEVFGLNREMIKPIKSDVLKLPAKRVNVNLSNEKLEQKTGVKMKDFTEGLIEMYNTKKSC